MESHIGTATSRVDGPAKVTGAALYAAEPDVQGLAHGFVVTATIPRGWVTAIDTADALRVQGVLAVLTHDNRPPMADSDDAYRDGVAPEEAVPYRPLFGDRVQFNGQPVALVLAEDWETARFAATLVRVSYAAEPFDTDLEAGRGRAETVDKPGGGVRGDPDAALAAAAARLQAEYRVPMEHHNPMELFASTAIWEGDADGKGGRITLYDKTQGVQNVQDTLCRIFDLPKDRLHVRSPYVGGAFGIGLRPQYQAVLAVLGARALHRSVRLVLTRRQTYALGYRPASIERLQAGAAADGRLDALVQEATCQTARHEAFFRNDTAWGGVLYGAPNARFEHRLVRLDLPGACDMRAPGAATGVYGLECAMDELAVALDMDPVALRLASYSDRDLNEGLPFTSKALRACYAQGAEAFGWSARTPQPRSMRDGRELVGWGMATGVWEALTTRMSARLVLTANGHVEVASATSDIGTGTYTIMAQMAADCLGVPLADVTVRLGDSSLPQAPVEGGSWTAASITHAIARTADLLKARLLAMAQAAPNSPLAGLDPAAVTLAGGRLVAADDASRGIAVADALRQAGLDRIEQEGSTDFTPDDKHARNTHSAVFAEVKIDEQLGVIRVTRMVSAIAAGRILNPRTARSQIIGAAVGGIGMALHEETLIDHRYGRVLNADIAEYHIPTHSDAPEIEVIFVDEPDAQVNPMGAKGVGEIGIVGVAAAIANAVYHATGVRVRDLPITLDKVVPG